MTNRIPWAAALSLIAFSLAGAGASGDALVDAAEAFLIGLSEGETAEALWRFDDPEREDVHYAPMGLEGLRHGDLEGEAHQAGEALLRSALSERGYGQLQAVRLLERDVRAGEWFFMRFTGFREPGRYFFAFFGEPSASEPWGFRYEGHHLSLNVTRAGGQIATTPLFLGAQPRLVPEGLPSAGTAVLGEEERLARALYASLDPAQRAAASLDYREDRGHMLGQVARLDAPEAVGLARSAMTGPQRATLDALLERFVGFFRADIAQAHRAAIASARGALHFAHVEADDPPHSFYTRISGPGVLVEIDNTEGGDHVHAVWHRPGADFGDDLLARHLHRHHGLSLARRGPR